MNNFTPPIGTSHAVANIRSRTHPFDRFKTVTADQVSSSLRTWAYAVAEWRLVAYWEDGMWSIETHGNVPAWLIAMYVNPK